MLAEWSAECSADDPILVVPWHDPGSGTAFVDLRARPYELDSIAEAEQHPPLMRALRALNASRSAVFSAKCDAWSLADEELEHLRMDLDVPSADAPCGFASYIDLVCRERSLFASFPRHEELLRRLARLAGPLDHPSATLDCVVRPALVDLDGPQQGFAFSLYVKALSADAETALQRWAAALESVVALVRGRELTRGNR